jgi:adenine-specific DNA-methyltransferase
VQPRKPRLAWQGMDRRELAATVPTQVVEIVRPGRAIERAGLAPQRLGARDGDLPPNRLIWTNDNLVALQTLLDEKDPQTNDWKYRGKVDLVYIDPPFMVNTDFVGENTIDIDFDDEGLDVPVKKEPSLVEILAYKDTWRQGLDSFLSMLRSRLALLKDLLAARGTIHVHLDWHTVHYVKVAMDEIFGYENFTNEIIWQRQTSHNDSGQGAQHMGRVHDSLLVYSRGAPNLTQVFSPYDGRYIRSHYGNADSTGRRFRWDNLIGPGGAAKGNPQYELLGHIRYWRHSHERMMQLVAEGRVAAPSPGGVPAYKRYLDEMPGIPLQDMWTDVSSVNSQAIEDLGYPTQKPVALLDRIISASCPPGGLVLDCFNGSGTTTEAAERLGRRWIGIDNGKYAIHLARKRLIQLHGQPRPPEKPQYEYPECKECGNIERKERRQKSPGNYAVRPFTVENMGVYQRAEEWQDFQKNRSVYRDEMVRVFGGEPAHSDPLLHGLKGRSWVHVGPLDAPISSGQVWAIARAAQATQVKNLDILSADFNTLANTEREEIKSKLGVYVTVRIIPKSAIDEVARRIKLKLGEGEVIETTAIPAFYAPLSIVLGKPVVRGRRVAVTLERCEVDIESFLASQRPLLEPIETAKTDKQRKQRQAVLDKWTERQKALDAWLHKATTWKKFVDFWAVDWNYQSRAGPDGKPIFETEWQSFPERRGKELAGLEFTAEVTYDASGPYQIAARVTDVFGNDGIATVTANVP